MSTPTLERPRKSPTLPAKSRAPSPSLILASGLLALLGFVPVLIYWIGGNDFWLFIGSTSLVLAMIGLSVTVATGYAGLISLMPFSFAGIGAGVTGMAMASWGWPFWLAVPLAALGTLPISMLLGVASVRLKGLYLAIATLTFSTALGETLFKWDRFTGGETGRILEKPSLGPIDFSGDLAFYLLVLVTILVLVWMAEGLRKSRVGRAMLAVKDNELEAQALGINVYKTKLVAVLISGMLAGVGGAYLASVQGVFTPASFQSPLAEITSILLVTLVVVGGIDRAWGAFFGAITFNVQSQVFQGCDLFFNFLGIYVALTLILFLLLRPGGLLQVGKIMIDLTKRSPMRGALTIGAIVAVNGLIAYLFLVAC